MLCRDLLLFHWLCFYSLDGVFQIIEILILIQPNLSKFSSIDYDLGSIFEIFLFTRSHKNSPPCFIYKSYIVLGFTIRFMIK